MTATPRPLQRTGGFTLIELLTVIAIIGILAAIMIPTIARVRFSANSVTCRNNLRQIANYMLIAANDNRGAIVDSTYESNDEITRIKMLLVGETTRDSEGKYTVRGSLISKGEGQKVLICPINKQAGAIPLVNPATTTWGCYYSACRLIYPEWNGSGTRIATPTRLDDPDAARIPIVWDERGDRTDNPMNKHHSGPSNQDEKSANFAYIDGSVRFIKYPQKIVP